MKYLNLILNKIKKLNIDNKTIIILFVGFSLILILFFFDSDSIENKSEEEKHEKYEYK